MKIKDIFKSVKDSEIANLEISNIADDSRKIANNSLFFIIKRPNFDIFSVLKEVESKTKVYVADIEDKNKIKRLVKTRPVIYRKNIKDHFQRAVKKFYKPKTNLKIVGITGTNGKTSTAYFLYQLLKILKKKVALFGTIGYFLNSTKYKTAHTTADFLTLWKMIKKASDQGIEYVIMEVSSHGIDQNRIKDIEFTRTVFTNLSRDHLDYHKSMKSYFKTKKSFFLQNPKAYSIINRDSDYGNKLLTSLDKTISYGIENKSDYQAKNIKLVRNKTEFDLIWKNKIFSVSMRIAGYHNVLNMLAAISSAHSLNISLSQIIKEIPSLKRAEGRFQEVSPNIFIDYAHTPQGLEHVLFSLRDIGYKEIIVVFGCGGQRDKGKRAMMGKISSQLADLTIITSDNPRGEDPLNICKQIKKGCINDKFKIIVDREKAIKFGIQLHKNKIKSGQKSCVLVAGKGHEDYQIFKNKTIYFKDSKVIKEILKNDRV